MKPMRMMAIAAASLWAMQAGAADMSFAGGYRPAMTDELKARLAAADVAAGAKFFDRKCSQCHDGEKTGGHAKGPHLWNVMGRQAGTIAGFAFSSAMQRAGVVWNYATLDHYLADTERAVPGREMNFAGLRDERLRAGVIAHLRTLGDTPPPLP